MAITKITSSVVANNAIIAAGVAENAITSSEIASNAVGTAQIASGAITTDMLDTNIDIAGTLDVTGVLTADSNVVIAGNLTVNGTTVTNSATNTTIEDALIELGTGTTGTPANDAGIVIERGDSDNAFIGWDESADTFILGTGSFTGASTGDLTISTAPITTGALTASGLSYPTSDGSANQVLITDGSGTLSFSSLPIDGAVVDNYTATGDGSTVTFDTGLNPQDEKNTWVFVGGVYQPKSSYSYNGTEITFSEAPPNGEDIDIVSGQVAGFDSAETVLGIYTTTTTATDTYDTGLSAANENNTFVFIEGVYQPKSTYTWSGSTITFDANTPADLALEVMATKTLSASAVTTNTIAANAVTSAKIASNAILARHIAENAIGASEIASNAQIVASTFTGALTGNVTGNVTGNLTGNVTSTGTSTFADIDVSNTSGDAVIDVIANNTTGLSRLNLGDSDGSTRGGLKYDNSNDSMAFRANGSDQMTLTNTGLGIGTTNPGSLLEVEGSNATGDKVKFGTSSNDNAGNFMLALQTNDANRVEFLATRQSSTGGSLDIYTRAVGGTMTNALTIDESQNVGIGTDIPAHRLQVINATAADDRTVASIAGVGNANSSTTGGQYLAVYRSGAIAGSSNNHAGGILLGISNSLSAANCGIRGTYEYTDGRDLQFFTSSDNTSAPTNKMIIKGNGDVGIGTDSPSKRLHVLDSTNELAIIENSGSGWVNIQFQNADCTGNGVRIGMNSTEGLNISNHEEGKGIVFRTTPTGGSVTEQARFTNEGNFRVGLSNSTPTNNTEAGFLVGGAAPGYGSAFIQIPNNASNGYGILGFYAGNYLLGNITKTGAGSCAYNTSSDYRLKENVNYDFNALDRVVQLKPARFNFIADADTTVDGFLAHEVQDIVPEAITGEKDAVDAEGNPEYQVIDHSKLVPLLVKALQEQQVLIEQLQSDVATLKGE